MAEYTHENIKVLEEMEHIQKNPGMYIGETDKPNHLVYELLDNALDEAQGGYASLVGVQIDSKEDIIIVADNGRGIPWQNNTIPTIATKLFSGGKFDKGENKAYGIASGLHGIGIVAVTALSEWMWIEVYRDKKYAKYKFENSKLVSEDIGDFEGKPPFKTQITFKPNKKYFDSTKIDIKDVRDRLRIASVHIPKLAVVFIIDGMKEVINVTLDQYFKEEVMGVINKDNMTDVFDLESKIKDESVKLRFCWEFNGSPTPKYRGCVNILKVDQGSHINSTSDVFRNVINEYATKAKMKFNKQDALIGLRCYTSIMLYEPSYSSQTKEKLSTSKVKIDHLYNIIEDKFRKMLKDNESLRNQLLSYFETYRRKQDSKKKIVKTTGSVSRSSCLIDSKLRDCTTHDVDKSELFITEGSSAGGSLVQCRDPKYHAILSLKGKIPNIAANDNFLKNKEIVEIINALGTGAEPDFHADGLRYGKIIFACDADSDGCARNNSIVYIKFKNEQICKLPIITIIENPDLYKDCYTLGYDEDKFEYVWTPIIKIWPHKLFHQWLDIEMNDGSIISLTHDHLVLTTRGWLRADELTAEDDIIDANTKVKNSKTLSNI